MHLFVANLLVSHMTHILTHQWALETPPDMSCGIAVTAGICEVVRVTGGCLHLSDNHSRDNTVVMNLEESEDESACGILSEPNSLLGSKGHDGSIL